MLRGGKAVIWEVIMRNRASVIGCAALVALWVLPLAAAAQEDPGSTTTTVEIETSATSITSTTETDSVAGGETSESPGDTLPFTGPPSQALAAAAALAIVAGILLVVLSGRSPDARPGSSLRQD